MQGPQFLSHGPQEQQDTATSTALIIYTAYDKQDKTTALYITALDSLLLSSVHTQKGGVFFFFVITFPFSHTNPFILPGSALKPDTATNAC